MLSVASVGWTKPPVRMGWSDTLSTSQSSLSSRVCCAETPGASEAPGPEVACRPAALEPAVAAGWAAAVVAAVGEVLGLGCQASVWTMPAQRSGGLTGWKRSLRGPGFRSEVQCSDLPAAIKGDR